MVICRMIDKLGWVQNLATTLWEISDDQLFAEKTIFHRDVDYLEDKSGYILVWDVVRVLLREV